MECDDWQIKLWNTLIVGAFNYLWQSIFLTYICLLFNFTWIFRKKATKGYEKRWNELQQYFNSKRSWTIFRSHWTYSSGNYLILFLLYQLLDVCVYIGRSRPGGSWRTLQTSCPEVAQPLPPLPLPPPPLTSSPLFTPSMKSWTHSWCTY